MPPKKAAVKQVKGKTKAQENEEKKQAKADKKAAKGKHFLNFSIWDMGSHIVRLHINEITMQVSMNLYWNLIYSIAN